MTVKKPFGMPLNNDMLKHSFLMIDSKQNKTVSLKSIHVETICFDAVSRTVITQEYKNEEETAIEALFCFPIEESAAVCRLSIKTGDVVIDAVSTEKEAAFQKYDDAIAKGHGAYLMDHEMNDVASLSLGNLLPGQEATVTIEYVSELKVIDGTIRIQIPVSLSPRYVPEGGDTVLEDKINQALTSEIPYVFSLECKIRRDGISQVHSPSHNTTLVISDEYYIVSLPPSNKHMDRDFIAEITNANPNNPFSVVSESTKGKKHCMMRLFPALPDEEKAKSQPREFIFLLDCSGSMSGGRIEQAKEALEICVRSMNEGDFFNIIRFGSDYEMYEKASQNYDEKSFSKAISYIKGIDADLGGTEMFGALQAAYQSRCVAEIPRVLVLLTDGEVGDEDRLFKLAASHGGVKVFTFGIGDGASRSIINGLAENSRASSEMVGSNEDLRHKVIRQFSRMRQPAVTIKNIKTTDISLELPRKFPPFYAGESFTFFAEVEKIGASPKAVIEAVYQDKEISFEMTNFMQVKDETVNCLWARSEIKTLQHEERMGSAQSDRRKKSKDKKIIELAEAYNLLTEYTSFVAIEKRQSSSGAGSPELRRIPIQMTRDRADLLYDLNNDLNICCYKTAPRAYNLIAPQLISKSFMAELAFSENFPADASANKTKGLLSQKTKEAVPFEDLAFDLLRTQQFNGSFTGLQEIIALFKKQHKIKVTEKQLKSLATQIDQKCTDKLAVLTTVLAVFLLERSAIVTAAGAAIEKANKYVLGNASEITIDGKPSTEFFQNKFGVQ